MALSPTTDQTPVKATTARAFLAKLLATEDISIRYSASAKTASFDLKNRVMTMPVWKGVSMDLQDMIIVHEVGHALNTPMAGWMAAIKQIAGSLNSNAKDAARSENSVRGFLNVVEDARIDRMQKRRYPGSKRNYINGYKELIDRDFFGTAKRDINTYPLIDRLNIYFKGGAAMGIKFLPQERKFIKMLEETETWKDVVSVTEQLYAYAKATQGQTESFSELMLTLYTFVDSDEDENGSDGDFESFDDDAGAGGDDAKGNETSDGSENADGDAAGKGDDSDSKKSDSKGDGKSNETGTGKDKSNSSGKNENKSKNENESGDSKNKLDSKGEAEGEIKKGDAARGLKGGHGLPDKASKPENDEVMPESLTDKTWEKKKESLAAGSQDVYIYCNIPKANIKEIVDDFKVVLADQAKENLNSARRASIVKCYKEFSDFKNSENSTLSFMVKEFETKKAADIYSRISIAKTGVIDTNKLHAYRYSEDIFRRLSIVPTGKNHGFVMIMDWSGSMRSYLQKTIKQLASLVLFCKRVQIPFDVYTFRDVRERGYGRRDAGSCFDAKGLENPFAMHDFKLRNILSSRMSLPELNQSFANLWSVSDYNEYDCDIMGGTPLNEAIIAAENVILDFQKRHRVQIVNTVFLTDGEANGNHYEQNDGQTYNYASKMNYILHDSKTKKDYDIGKSSYFGTDLTKALLKVLKDRTGCNLIGFYILNSKIQYLYSRFFPEKVTANSQPIDQSHFEKIKSCWHEEGFVDVETAGYDKYYLLNSSNMNIKNESFDVDNTMTRNKVIKEFMKFSSKKTVNRMLLRSFIEEIAK
jgi:hypothetical protein